MAKALEDLAAFLAGKYDVAKIRLEPFVDDRRGCDALVATPEFRTEDPDELLEIHGDILDIFFCPRKLFSPESIVLSF